MLSSFVTLFLMLTLVMFPLLIPAAITVAPTLRRLRHAPVVGTHSDRADWQSKPMSGTAARHSRPASVSA